MEKVKIVKCTPIMGNQAHGVTLADGRECTAWNDKIDAGLLMQAYSTGGDAEMEIVPYTSKAGKSGFNIKAINVVGTAMTNQAPALLPQATMGSAKDNSIIAQCMVKAAVELLKGESWNNVEEQEFEEILNRKVGYLVGAYRVAVQILDR